MILLGRLRQIFLARLCCGLCSWRGVLRESLLGFCILILWRCGGGLGSGLWCFCWVGEGARDPSFLLLGGFYPGLLGGLRCVGVLRLGSLWLIFVILGCRIVDWLVG